MTEQAPNDVERIAASQSAERKASADAFWAKKGLNVAGLGVGFGTLFIPGLGPYLGTITLAYNFFGILRKK
jgi:hypothetical protein